MATLLILRAVTHDGYSASFSQRLEEPECEFLPVVPDGLVLSVNRPGLK